MCLWIVVLGMLHGLAANRISNAHRGQWILIRATFCIFAHFGINSQHENPDSLILSDAFTEKSMKYLMSSKDIASVLFLRIHSSTFNTRSVQVNLCQKLLVLHHLTHNMMPDCSLFMKIVSSENLQNMLCTQIVVFCFVLTFRTILVLNLFYRCCELLKKIYL